MKYNNQEQKQEYISPWVLYLVGASFICIWFVASCIHGRFTWGFDYLRYYPLWLQLAWAGSGLGMLTLIFFYSKKKQGTETQHEKSWHLYAVLVVVAVCAIVFRNKVPLLGDSGLRRAEISQGRLISITEPLTTMVHGLVYGLFKRIFHGDTAALSYIVVSIIAGLGCATIYYFIAERWFRKAKWFCLIFLMSLGLNQIFYGYIESYALFTMCVAWYIWSGVSAFREEKRPVAATIVCSLSIAFHSASVLLVPSLLFLWWHHFHRKKDAHGIVGLAALLLAGPAVTYITGFLVAKKQFSLSLTEAPLKPLLPLWQGIFGDGIISLTHMADILNQLLLIVPGGLFLLIILLFSMKNLMATRRLTFLLITLSGGLLFMLIVNPQLGAPRDWDLFAWVGIPLVYVVLVLLRNRKDYRLILSSAAVVSLWLFWPWIGINATEDLSVRRFHVILQNETKSAAYGYESLARYYLERDDTYNYEQVCKTALEREPHHARLLQKYAMALYMNGKYDSAAIYVTKAIEADSMQFDYWYLQGLILCALGHHEQGLRALQKSFDLNSRDPHLLYALGTVHLDLAQWAKADSAFYLAKRFGYDDGWLYLYWGQAQLHLRQFEKAKEYLERALERGLPREQVRPTYNIVIDSLAARRIQPPK